MLLSNENYLHYQLFRNGVIKRRTTTGVKLYGSLLPQRGPPRDHSSRFIQCRYSTLQGTFYTVQYTSKDYLILVQAQYTVECILYSTYTLQDTFSAVTEHFREHFIQYSTLVKTILVQAQYNVECILYSTYTLQDTFSAGTEHFREHFIHYSNSSRLIKYRYSTLQGTYYTVQYTRQDSFSIGAVHLRVHIIQYSTLFKINLVQVQYLHSSRLIQCRYSTLQVTYYKEHYTL